jgi:chemotaxis protein CheD
MFWDSGRQRCKGSLLVQSNNLSAAQAWLARHEIAVVAEHVGGAGHRQIIFDIATGDVWVKHVPLMVS